MSKNNEIDVVDNLEERIFALLSYLNVLCLVALVVKKDSKFVLKHGRQGLVLFIGQIAVFVLHIILGTWFLRLGLFVFGVLSFIGIIFALRGKYIDLPGVSQIMDKIKF